MSSPPPPLAPGGGGYHGRSGGRGNGTLYLATQKARAAAARRKEARANLLAPPPPSTPSNRAARYKIHSDEKSLSEAPPATKLPHQKIIFDELPPVAETTTPFESSPPVVASPPLQQPTTGVELPALPPFELPALLQFPGGVLNTQPPTVDISPTQLCDAFMPTAAGADNYVLNEHDEDEVLLSSDDEEVAVKAACAASQLCRDPNNDTDDYCFCLNCNVEAHLICIDQMDFQTLLWINS